MQSFNIKFIRKIKVIWQNKFVRKVLVIASGTAGAQALTISFIPILTRLYDPIAFGMLGTFNAIVAMLVPLGALAYPIAVVLPSRNRDAIELMRISIYISLIFSLLILPSLWVLHLMLQDWTGLMSGLQSFEYYLPIISVTLLLSVWAEVIRQWLIRKQRYGAIARATIVQSLVANLSKFGFGHFYPTGSTLIYVTLLSILMYSISLSLYGRRTLKKYTSIFSNKSTEPLSRLCLKYRDFPLFRAPQYFISAASQSIPILILAKLFGPEQAGLYALAKLTMGAPSALLGKAVNDVIYPKLVDMNRAKENIHRHVVRVTAGLFFVGLVPFGLVIIFGSVIYEFSFGENWVLAGSYAQWLAVLYFFNFINKPSVSAVAVMGMERGLLIYEIFSSTIKILGLSTGLYIFKDALFAIAFYSILGAVSYIVMMWWIFYRTSSWKYDG